MIRRIRRKRDVAPVVMAAIKFIGPMLASQVVGAVGASFKEKITDPAFQSGRDAALNSLRRAAMDPGTNEARSARVLRNARAEVDNLKRIARRESIPIVNQLHAFSQGLKSEEIAMLRGDSRPSKLRDSRRRRSVKRPGRATSWETKQVIGWTQPDQLPKDYEGWVERNGDVHVNRKGVYVGSMTNAELDRREITEKMRKSQNVPFYRRTAEDIRNENTFNSAVREEKSIADKIKNVYRKFKSISTGIESMVAESQQRAERLNNMYQTLVA